MNYDFNKLSDHDLKIKIRRAYAWLMTHESPLNKDGLGFKIGIVGNKWKHFPEEYNQNLRFYEQAVDEAKNRGIKEKSCWVYQDNTITVDDTTLEENILAMVK